MMVSRRVDSAIFAALSAIVVMLWHMLMSNPKQVPFDFYAVIIGGFSVVAFLNYFDRRPDYK
jgi:hypothetical protein